MNLRLQKLRKLLTEEKLDAVFISSLPNIIYLSGFSDFSTFDRDGFLLVTKTKQYIFTHGIYKEAVEQHVKNFTLIDIKRENTIGQAIKNIVVQEKINLLGFEAFDLKVNEYDRLIKEIDKNILMPTTIIHQLRIEKTHEEIKAIKKACQLGDKTFDFIITKIKLGVTEIEIAVALEFFIKNLGAVLSFDSVIAFGANASKPHHVPTKKKLQTNSFVLLDFGVKLNNYCSDMTRTIFFGNASAKQKQVYLSVLESQQEAIVLIKNNLKTKQQIIGKQADTVSREYLINKGYPSIPHSLGHGIGIELHEPPRLTPLSDEILEAGMVFSIEPGIYLPGKFGVRIEDLFAIEANKLIQLTNSPKNFIEL